MQVHVELDPITGRPLIWQPAAAAPPPPRTTDRAGITTAEEARLYRTSIKTDEHASLCAVLAGALSSFHMPSPSRSHRNPAQIRCRCYTTTRRHAPRQPRRGRARRTGCAGTAARAVASAQASCSAVGCEVFSRSGEREERGKSKVPNENLELGLGT